MRDWRQKKSVWCYELQLRRVHVTWIRDGAPKWNHQGPAGEGSLLVTPTSTAATQRNWGGSLERWPSPFFLRGHFSAMDWAHHVQFLGAQKSSSVTYRILGVERKPRYAACLFALKQQSLEAQPYSTCSFLFKAQEILGRNCIYWVCLAVPSSPRFFFR